LRKETKGGGSYQLAASILIDVCYRLYADVIPNKDKSSLPEKSQQWDKKTTSPGHAYQAIFNRRLNRGQSYSIPSLGWREFTPSYVGPFREETQVETNLPSIEIPSMLRQVFPHGYNSPRSFQYDTNVVIEKGVLIYD
jgi:CRISPR-associated protein Cas5d